MEIGEHEQRVSAGYNFILNRIGIVGLDNLDFSLDVADYDLCPLALATGKPYHQARKELGITAAAAIELGFSFRMAYGREDIDGLNAAWRKKVLHRSGRTIVTGKST